MRISYVAVGAAAGFILVFAAAANAHSTGGGVGVGGGAPSSPPGFTSGGNHQGFDRDSGSTASPRGWDHGKADWKTDSPDSPTSSATLSPDSALAPGFTRR